MGLIKRNSYIIDAKDLNSYKIPKDIYVRFYTLQDQDGYYYLKSKNRIFKTRPWQISQISTIVNLDESPNQFTDWTQRRKDIDRKETSYDYSLNLAAQIAISGDGFYQKLVKDDSNSLVDYKTLNMQILKELENLGAIGAGLSLERASMKEEFNTTSLFFELAFKTPKKKVFNNPFSLNLAIGNSVYSELIQTSLDNSSTKLNQFYLDLKIESPIHYQWGDLILGISYQRKWLRVTKSETDADLSVSDNSENLLGMHIKFTKGFSW